MRASFLSKKQENSGLGKKIILDHPDLTIEVSHDVKGHNLYSGKSLRYKPYEAVANSALDCLFCFDIQLAEQKKIAGLLNI